MNWIHYSLLSGFLLASRTIIARLSQNLGLSAADGIAYQSLSLALLSFVIYLFFNFLGYGELNIDKPGVTSALFVGVLNGIGGLTIFLALKDGFGSLMTVLVFCVSLLVVTVCSPIMGDVLEFKHYMAVIFAMIAAALTI